MSTQPKTQTKLLPYALAAGAGKPMSWFGSSIILKASSPDLGVVEIVMNPGDEPPFHVHKNEDEWFYVLEGEMTFHVGNENYSGSAGTFVSFPRGIPHTFTVESPTAHAILMNTPGGFERMFELAPKTPEDAVRAMEAFGMTVTGPHPRQVRSAA
jgi:quercetin dioxygenase-like cupin family protein